MASIDEVKDEYQFVDRIGVELEGAWEEFTPLNFKYDGSVSFDSAGVGWSTGESNSNPVPPAEVRTYLDENYPDAHNETCGIHTHISCVDPKHILTLASKEFDAFFNTRLREWARNNEVGDVFWGRLGGENEYCLAEFIAYQQLCDQGRRSDRYRQINFCSFHEHGTVEFRLLPVFPSCDVAHKAIVTIINIVEDYLFDRATHSDDSTVGDPQELYDESVIGEEDYYELSIVDAPCEEAFYMMEEIHEPATVSIQHL